MAKTQTLTRPHNNSVVKQPLRTLGKIFGLSFVFDNIWKCPQNLLEQQFRRNVSLNHLEVGVNNDFDFTRRLKANSKLNIAYLDPSVDALRRAKKQTNHLKPRLFHGDLDDKWHFKHHKFDSVNLNFVLHGMEGDFESRVNALCLNARRCLSDKGKVFGSAILRDRINTSSITEFVINRYNDLGTMNNEKDNLRKFERMLSYYFANVKVELVGYVVMFEGKMKESRRRGRPEMEPYNARNNVVNLPGRREKKRAAVARTSTGVRAQFAG